MVGGAESCEYNIVEDLCVFLTGEEEGEQVVGGGLKDHHSACRSRRGEGEAGGRNRRKKKETLWNVSFLKT